MVISSSKAERSNYFVVCFSLLTDLKERVGLLRWVLGADISPLLNLRMFTNFSLFLSASESRSALLPRKLLSYSDSSKLFSSILLKLAPRLISFIFSYSSYSPDVPSFWFNYYKALLSLNWKPLFIPVYNLRSKGFSSLDSSTLIET